jgi:hypothetical protein
MDDIVFHSLYNESDLKNLKHSLLYFNNVTIPLNYYACQFGDKHLYPHYLQLVPESVHKEIEYLGKHNFVNIHEFEGGEYDNISKYYDAIVDGAKKLGRNRNYSKEQIHQVANYLKLDLNHPELFLIVNEATTFLAAICLMEFSVHQRVCCNDNIIIHDAMNLGVKRALQIASENILETSSNFRELKRNILAYKVLSLNLPSFEFQTFEDIFEIKEKHKDELLALDNHLDDLTEKLDKSPYDEGFDDELNRLMDHRIQPEIDNLFKSISFSPSRVVKNTFKPLWKFGLAFGFSSCFPAYTKEIATGITAKVVDDLFKDFNETRKKIKESPYNIFLALNNK